MAIVMAAELHSLLVQSRRRLSSSSALRRWACAAHHMQGAAAAPAADDRAVPVTVPEDPVGAFVPHNISEPIMGDPAAVRPDYRATLRRPAAARNLPPATSLVMSLCMDSCTDRKAHWPE